MTVVGTVKLVPVIVTMVPPPNGPALGDEIPVTVGTAMKVNLSKELVALVPPPFDVVTVTSTVPAVCAGEVAVICISELTV